jgi:hypothetical protein
MRDGKEVTTEKNAGKNDDKNNMTTMEKRERRDYMNRYHER